jgi:hypothetical protein
MARGVGQARGPGAADGAGETFVECLTRWLARLVEEGRLKEAQVAQRALTELSRRQRASELG